eukprot:1800906-Amphidinium_carterae.1
MPTRGYSLGCSKLGDRICSVPLWNAECGQGQHLAEPPGKAAVLAHRSDWHTGGAFAVSATSSS